MPAFQAVPIRHCKTSNQHLPSRDFYLQKSTPSSSHQPPLDRTSLHVIWIWHDIFLTSMQWIKIKIVKVPNNNCCKTLNQCVYLTFFFLFHTHLWKLQGIILENLGRQTKWQHFTNWRHIVSKYNAISYEQPSSSNLQWKRRLWIEVDKSCWGVGGWKIPRIILPTGYMALPQSHSLRFIKNQPKIQENQPKLQETQKVFARAWWT